MEFLNDVHGAILSDDERKTTLVCGNYSYFYYGIDGVNDHGWGCGYRTLQTIISHFIEPEKVPSIGKIQEELVEIGDKPDGFKGSKEWIGSVEVAYMVDSFTDHPCRIKHYPAGQSGRLADMREDIVKHFEKGQAAPIMMGGNRDTSSKAVVGIKNDNLLIVDPHHYKDGLFKTADEVVDAGLIYWHKLEDINFPGFHNFCFPL